MHVNKEQSCELHCYQHNRTDCSRMINFEKFKVTLQCLKVLIIFYEQKICVERTLHRL